MGERSSARTRKVAIWSRSTASVGQKRSAVQWPERIAKPVLIMHGGADPQVSPLHALRLATRLQELGKTYQLLIVDGGTHTLMERPAERDAMVAEYFRRYLDGE